MLVLSDGDLDQFIVVARLGLADWRDLRVSAQERRHPGDQCALRDTSGLQLVSHHRLPS